MRIVGVYGSLRPGSYTAILVDHALASAERRGAEVRKCDLRELALPMFEDDADYSADAAHQQVTELVKWADGFILGSPEYHGSMSGALKNFFDHYYHEFSGKCFGLVAAAGGGNAVSCFTHMRASVQYCHGWSLPYQIGATRADFEEGGTAIKNPRVIDRLDRLARDLVVYGALLKEQFDRDLPVTEGVEAGFATWHRSALSG